MRLSFEQPMTFAGSVGEVFILWEIEITRYDSLTVIWKSVTVIVKEEIRKRGNPGKMEISRAGPRRAAPAGARAGLTAYSDVITLRNALRHGVIA